MLMPQQIYSMLSEMRAIRLIYYVYSVYLPIVATEHYNASPQWQECPCSHNTEAMSPLAILGSMLSHFMSPHPILERLNTTFVWLCWCKSHCLGVSNYKLHWSDITSSYLSMLCWATKITWGVGTTFQIGRLEMAFHLAPHKNDTFVPQGS